MLFDTSRAVAWYYWYLEKRRPKVYCILLFGKKITFLKKVTKHKWKWDSVFMNIFPNRNTSIDFQKGWGLINVLAFLEIIRSSLLFLSTFSLMSLALMEMINKQIFCHLYFSWNFHADVAIRFTWTIFTKKWKVSIFTI